MAARFYCNVTPVDGDGTRLRVYARFTGGSTGYTYKRSITVRVIGVGSFDFDSNETGGGTSTFSGYIYGLSPGTDYEWICNLFYWSGSWTVSEYADEGVATTYKDSSSGKVYINGEAYTPYIYTGSWNAYTPLIYTTYWG